MAQAGGMRDEECRQSCLDRLSGALADKRGAIATLLPEKLLPQEQDCTIMGCGLVLHGVSTPHVLR
jgi:hypothetical protein